MQRLVIDLERTVEHSFWVQNFNFIQNADLSLLKLYDYYWTLPDEQESFWLGKEEWTTVEGTSLVYRQLEEDKSVFRGTVAARIGTLAIADSGETEINCGTVEVFDRPAKHAPFDTWIPIASIKLSLFTNNTTYAQDVLVQAVIGTLSSSSVTRWFGGCAEIVPKLSLEIKPCGKGCLVTLFLEKLLPYISEEYSNSKNIQ